MWIANDTRPPEPCSPAMDRYLQSMKIGYIEWHDGISYDLDALKELSHEELNYIEALHVSRKDEDWRDIEAPAACAPPPPSRP